ncbi:Cwf15/Cwc15 cell cycle control protein [Wallemia mellicola]|uniref:Cwf15/Cwc15 cell cycle control protein n=2 Tax=Wallemia mellicola TaxID=1708541 RepID=A0A4T0QK68_9BASI|nr:Cwf15/Cwc15 cell cycle control protein [Wallemia mellicola CBS 633.66]TIB72250.1 hypothetical protein E3Q24_01821 [Wallemia mellicola]EIM22958.1 Cwf15/Cwc15 cell cycle control protein [Wallemia mellicola CBS 633.66]TIB75507.1 hypothetical protein E3Q23_02375 [Wallemia mellicola]TIB81916.1 Cwf15/Cwc15 cell cycle control protein [Wallemia mellicola]TIB86099.1 Cwf15/Cwc15 cell cycle control protein [Wallemia mellicola]|eukprot:XP_006957003.1 Cwf15/Cwc15 cell cycle control protein [Wallemia mellicola CBS 633.66]
MSTAHRPTWDPAVGRADSKAQSQQYSARDAPSHNKLKFRKPGQGGNADQNKRRDLRLELTKAEEEANEKKRKAEGISLEEIGQTVDNGDQKKAKLLEDVDKDEQPGDSVPSAEVEATNQQSRDNDEEADDDESDEDSEDDEAELLRELEKIKRERAEEKARKDEESNNAKAASREEEIASGNPLLNLQNALGASPSSSTQESGFAVKRRWDDDLIFKNQALNTSEKPKKEFVNDLVRTDFHRKFMYRFIK